MHGSFVERGDLFTHRMLGSDRISEEERRISIERMMFKSQILSLNLSFTDVLHLHICES